MLNFEVSLHFVHSDLDLDPFDVKFAL